MCCRSRNSRSHIDCRAVCYPGIAQHLPAGATEQPSGPIAALAERLAVQLLAAGKRKPYILDLSLVNDQPCPLGNWLADRLSEALLHAHPELEVIARGRWNWQNKPRHSRTIATRNTLKTSSEHNRSARKFWFKEIFAAVLRNRDNADSQRPLGGRRISI